MQEQFTNGQVLFIRLAQERQIIWNFIGQIETTFIIKLHYGQQRSCCFRQRSQIINIRRLHFLAICICMVSEAPVIQSLTILHHQNLTTGISSLLDSLQSNRVDTAEHFRFHSIFFGYKVERSMRSNRNTRTGRKQSANTGRQSSICRCFTEK